MREIIAVVALALVSIFLLIAGCFTLGNWYTNVQNDQTKKECIEAGYKPVPYSGGRVYCKTW